MPIGEDVNGLLEDQMAIELKTMDVLVPYTADINTTEPVNSTVQESDRLVADIQDTIAPFNDSDLYDPYTSNLARIEEILKWKRMQKEVSEINSITVNPVTVAVHRNEFSNVNMWPNLQRQLIVECDQRVSRHKKYRTGHMPTNRILQCMP